MGCGLLMFRLNFPKRYDNNGFYSIEFYLVMEKYQTFRPPTEKLIFMGRVILDIKIPMRELKIILINYYQRFGNTIVTVLPKRDIINRIKDVVQYIEKNSNEKNILMNFFPNVQFKNLRPL